MNLHRSENPQHPFQTRIRDAGDLPAERPAVECNRGLAQFNALLDEDMLESGCVRYLVFYEGDGRWLAWRDEE